MTDPLTASGRILTEADLDAIAEEVETSDYDIATLRKRRRGRPAMGSGPAEVVPVRIDPELRAAVAARAETDGTTTSEVIREALRRFLDVEQAERAQHAWTDSTNPASKPPPVRGATARRWHAARD